VTSRDFCYWLQGLFELGEPVALNETQTKAVRAHLALVFKHEIDPAAGGPAVQAALNAIHETSKPPPVIGGTGPAGTVYRC
jgi:hypothetical protein